MLGRSLGTVKRILEGDHLKEVAMMDKVRPFLSRLRANQTVRRLSLNTNPLRLALFLLMLSAWAVVAAAGHVVSFLALLLVGLAKGIGRAREWLYNLSNERIYLSLLILAIAGVCFQAHLAEIRSRPLTYAIIQEQDSTFVAQIKQCCAKAGWVWADSPGVRQVARNVYGGQP